LKIAALLVMEEWTLVYADVVMFPEVVGLPVFDMLVLAGVVVGPLSI
jgi:hypothetical protein